MTYVTDKTQKELRAHMRRLQAMPGWHDPLADRLLREVIEQDAEIARLRLAAEKVIEMNLQHAKDQYGDANKAESWSCVTVLRAVLTPQEQA